MTKVLMNWIHHRVPMIMAILCPFSSFFGTVYFSAVFFCFDTKDAVNRNDNVVDLRVCSISRAGR
ncbi:Uncharacterised protein [Chlamydia trachomatis]|nr:Uncharacterised protein [Chlamydia trachomatis]